MAAVFYSAIDKACFASPEAVDADAAVALLAAAVLLVDFAMSACNLLTCCCSSSIRASIGLRSVQSAVSIRAKIEAFEFSFTPFSMTKFHRPKLKYGALSNRHPTRLRLRSPKTLTKSWSGRLH